MASFASSERRLSVHKSVSLMLSALLHLPKCRQEREAFKVCKRHRRNAVVDDDDVVDLHTLEAEIRKTILGSSYPSSSFARSLSSLLPPNEGGGGVHTLIL